MKSWKTTLAGVLSVLPMILHALFPEIVTLDAAATITAALASLGLIAAKDGNVSGKPNDK